MNIELWKWWERSLQDKFLNVLVKRIPPFFTTGSSFKLPHGQGQFLNPNYTLFSVLLNWEFKEKCSNLKTPNFRIKWWFFSRMARWQKNENWSKIFLEIGHELKFKISWKTQEIASKYWKMCSKWVKIIFWNLGKV